MSLEYLGSFYAVSVRVCPEAICFEHKNTKTHLSRPKKVPFPVFMCKVSGWLAHKKKHSFFPPEESDTNKHR